MSKGSGRRPSGVPEAQVDDNWQRTFAPKLTEVDITIKSDNSEVCEKLRWMQREGASFAVLGRDYDGEPATLLDILKCPPE